MEPTKSDLTTSLSPALPQTNPLKPVNYKIYEFKSPIDGKTEMVYEYPEVMLPEWLKTYLMCYSLPVTREVEKPPVLFIPKKYLKEQENQRATGAAVQLDITFQSYFAEHDEDVYAYLPPDARLNRFLAKIIIQIVHPELKDDKQRLWYLALPYNLRDFAATAMEKKYPWSYVKDIVVKHIDMNLRMAPGISFEELQQQFPCEVISDSGALSEICDKVLTLEAKSVADYKKGKVAALNHLKGKVMRETKGKADIAKVEELLKAKMA